MTVCRQIAIGIAVSMLYNFAWAGDEKTLDFSDFDAVQVSEGVRVHIHQGDEFSVTAKAISGDVERLIVKQYGSWLVFERNQRWWIFANGRTDEIEVQITLPELENVKSFEDSFVSVHGIEGRVLRAEVKEDAVLHLDSVNVDKLNLITHQGGTLRAMGSCQDIKVEERTGGSLDLTQLSCQP